MRVLRPHGWLIRHHALIPPKCLLKRSQTFPAIESQTLFVEMPFLTCEIAFSRLFDGTAGRVSGQLHLLNRVSSLISAHSSQYFLLRDLLIRAYIRQITK
jgi:hypothetical protein